MTGLRVLTIFSLLVLFVPALVFAQATCAPGGMGQGGMMQMMGMMEQMAEMQKGMSEMPEAK